LDGFTLFHLGVVINFIWGYCLIMSRVPLYMQI
jgi:hypothetical protein